MKDLTGIIAAVPGKVVIEEADPVMVDMADEGEITDRQEKKK